MLLDQPVLSEEKARLLSPLQLAYIGDAVWDILVRTGLVLRGLNVRHMHAEVIRVSTQAHRPEHSAGSSRC